MNLNELRDKAYQCAVAHGWHEENQSDEHWLCLVISELMEAVEADRKCRNADRKEFEEIVKDIPEDVSDSEKADWFRIAFKNNIKDTVEDELADVCIRLLDLAGMSGIDLSDTNEIADELVSLKSDFKLTEICFGFTSALTANGESLENRICGTIAGLIKYCQFSDVDLEWHINRKMKYNELRPYKHGSKAY